MHRNKGVKMCLKQIDYAQTSILRAEDSPITAYKWLVRHSTFFESPFYDQRWKVGRKYKSSRYSQRLTPGEKQRSIVGFGFHFFFDRHLEYLPIVLAEFEILPSEVVAVGIDIPTGHPSMVSMSAKFIRVIDDV